MLKMWVGHGIRQVLKSSVNEKTRPADRQLAVQKEGGTVP